MVSISPILIKGQWNEGYALDLHTKSSEYVGDSSFRPEFNTEHTELGELLYKLKNKGDQTVIDEIVKAVVSFFQATNLAIDLIVPVPPSRDRSIQPVIEVSRLLADTLGLDFCADCINKVKDTPELKNESDYKKRVEILRNAFEVDKKVVNGKRVLLFDDIYRSGATMNAVTTALIYDGEAESVFALALTKTRTRR